MLSRQSLQKGSKVNVHLLVQVQGKSICEQSHNQQTVQIQTHMRYEKGDRPARRSML